tara:strand:+ start:32 stop:307 length:276 start_codon:yes stop_codon:yes gene_type:complete
VQCPTSTLYYDGVVMEVKEPVQQTPKVFSLEIENIVKEKHITHMDAVLLYCYKNGIEPDKVSSLITKALKEKIENNARELNFLPKTAQLPI